MAGQHDNSFPAGNERQRFSVPRVGFQNRGKEASCLLCLAAELVGQQHRFISQAAADFPGGGAQFPDASVDLRMDIIQRFGSFHIQQLQRGLRHLQAVFLLNPPCVLRRGSIGAGWSGGNHVQWISQDIRKDDRFHLRRPAQLGKPSALDSAEPLPDGIDFHDIRPAGQQLSCNILQFLSGNQRFFKQSASSSRKQEQHRIFLRQVRHQIQRSLRSAE